MKWFFIGLALFVVLVLADTGVWLSLLLASAIAVFFSFIMRQNTPQEKNSATALPPIAQTPPATSRPTSYDTQMHYVWQRLTKLEREVAELQQALNLKNSNTDNATEALTPASTVAAASTTAPPNTSLPATPYSDNRAAALSSPTSAPSTASSPVPQLHTAAMAATTTAITVNTAPATTQAAATPLPSAPQQPATAVNNTPAPVHAIPPSAPAQIKPPAPDPVSLFLGRAKAWLLGGNPLVRVGVLILFFGVSFLLKLAAEYGMFPIELRLATVAAGAVALLGIGWRLREKRREYALILQGGGIGILYLLIFAAFRLYNLLPSLPAFALMLAVCGASAFLAIRQDARSFAIMGATGGFLAPLLISTGSGNHIALFSYYALLNAGILAIAWFKSWRSLNLLGFVFTFGIGTLWGWRAYTPEHFATTEPFLILFLLFYIAVGLLYALRRPHNLKSVVDGTLVFGTPLAFSGLQAAMLTDSEYGMAWSALALGLLYLVITAGLYRYRQERLKLLFESTLALGVLFITLAVPLAFDGRLTSAVWAVEGAAVLWVAVRQQRRLALACALALQLFSAAAFTLAFGHTQLDAHASWPILNSDCIGMLMLAFSALFSGWMLQRPQTQHASAQPWLPNLLPLLSVLAGAWGLGWWLFAGATEIAHNTSTFLQAAPYTVLLALLTAWMAHAARSLLQWCDAQWVALALTPVLLLQTLGYAFLNFTPLPPLTGLGAFVWPLAIVLAGLLLYRQQKYCNDTQLGPMHTGLFWTFAGIVALQWHNFTLNHSMQSTWSWSSWALIGATLLALLSLANRYLAWPTIRYRRYYLLGGGAPLALLLCLWSFLSLFNAGDAAPLPYLPLLNPLEFCQLLVFAALFVWVRQLGRSTVEALTGTIEYAAFALCFFWLNTVLMRSLHAFLGVEYHISAILESINLQQGFILLWIVFAFVGFFALRDLQRRQRFLNLLCPVMIALWCWTFYANTSNAGSEWGRLPLFNPLDITLLAVFATFARYLQLSRRDQAGLQMSSSLVAGAAGISAFLWLNAMLLRALHHWLEIPYQASQLFASTTVQAALSLLWALLALVLMVVAVRRAIRPLWFIGISLLGLTVAKLFLIELANIGSVERIFSFIGVGMLLLLIGYLAPLPPKRSDLQDEKT